MGEGEGEGERKRTRQLKLHFGKAAGGDGGRGVVAAEVGGFDVGDVVGFEDLRALDGGQLRVQHDHALALQVQPQERCLVRLDQLY